MICLGGGYENQARVSIPSDLKSIERPTLIVIGDKDEWMPMDQVRKAMGVLNGVRQRREGLKLDVVVFDGVRPISSLFPSLPATSLSTVMV